MLHGRCLFRVADQVGQAGGVLNRGAVSSKLRPWPGAAKGRHGYHHQARVGFDEVRVIELQFWQYAAGVVFNQGVRRCDELQQQFASSRIFEIQRDVLLVAIHVEILWRFFCAVVRNPRLRGLPAAPPVKTLAAFYLDYLCTHVRQITSS